MTKGLDDFFKIIEEGKRVAAEKHKERDKALAEAQERIKNNNPFATKTKVAEIVETIVEEKKDDSVLTEELNEILSTQVSPVNPSPAPIVASNDLKPIEQKMKYLENWVSRIASTGPGSGEVNFRYLDDVNRATLTPTNNNWVLEYDAATKKVQFTNEIGPIEHVQFDINHVDSELEVPGTICWDFEDHTLNIHHQNGVTQQIGQETYYLVRNRTGSTITNGTVCRFAGAESDGNARLLIAPMIADGTYPSLYIMGIATEDIVDGADGFVTSFGRVSDINTTGGSENWQLGDILYVSPTVAGGLTNIKPTAPNNVIPVASVLHVGTTDGHIFVRPTIEQKMLYGRFSDSTDQVPLLPDTPYAILFNSTDVARGFHADGGTYPTSTIFAEESGYYSLSASISLTSTNSSAKAFYVWLRKNGVDVPNSARRQSIVGNGTYQILTYRFTTSLNKNDYFEIMYAASDAAISINSPAATTFCPAIPSVTLLVTQIAL